MVRELSRGEVIGEMSLYTGEPRSATVIAVRDSVLVRLAKEHFEALLVSHPQVSLTFTRQMIRRLQTEHERHPMAAPVTVGLLPVSAGVAVGDFAQRLAESAGTVRPRGRGGQRRAMDRLLGERGHHARARMPRPTTASRLHSTASKLDMTSCCCWPMHPGAVDAPLRPQQ